MNKEVKDNRYSLVIASEAKQSHVVKIGRLLRCFAPRNDFLADLKA